MHTFSDDDGPNHSTSRATGDPVGPLTGVINDRKIIDRAVTLLHDGEVLSLDALARSTGLTKPGVLYHVGSKQNLMLLVVEEVVNRWEVELRRYPSAMGPRAGDAPFRPTAVSRLRSYVDFAFTHSFGAADLALFADPRLQQRLRDQWTERLEPWLGPRADQRTAVHVAVRLLADGMWFNEALGTDAASDAEKERVRALAHRLLDEATDDDAEATDSDGTGTP